MSLFRVTVGGRGLWVDIDARVGLTPDTGEVIDTDHGLVWRWERRRE
jgi:hypothetical protein